MRIAYLSRAIIPSRTADGIHVIRMCDALARLGHEVHLIVPRSDAGQVRDVPAVREYYGVTGRFHIEWPTTAKWAGGRVGYSLFAARRACAIGPDLVYAPDLPTLSVLASTRIPKIYEAHVAIADLGIAGPPLFRHLARSRSLVEVITVSEALREQITGAFPALAAPVRVVRNGADPVPADLQPHALRGSAQALRVGYVGHLYRGRGVDLLLEAAGRLEGVASFHIAGGDPGQVAELERDAAGRANFFVYGHLPPAACDRFRIACDVLVAPYQARVAVAGNRGDSSRWMSPLKIFDYMAAGRAIVCSDLPAVREVLTDGEDALLVEPADPEQWVQALARLARDPALRERLGGQARTRFMNAYTWDARARSVLERFGNR